jgi:hypothetical protein
MAADNTLSSATPIDGLFRSSDYKLNIVLITSDGQQVTGLQNLLVSFNLYEDLFSPYMSGDFDFPDAHDVLTSYKFHGNEYLYLELDKPTLNKPIKKYFRIYKVSNRTQTTQSLQTYRMHFCSEELILSTQILLRKSYKGMLISAMVKDVLNNVLQVDPSKTKDGIFTDTSGNFNIIVPKMQPLEAASWLTTRAYADSQTLFFFFENRDGYNFTSYENLIKIPPYTTYFRAPKVTVEPGDNFRSYNFINVTHDFDIMKTNRFGGFATSLYVYDILSRQYVKNTLASPTLGSGSFLNKNPIVNLSLNRFNKSLYDSVDSMQKFYPTTDSDPNGNPLHPERFLNQHAIKLAQLNNLKITIVVPLDPLLKVGQVISLEIPKMTPQEEGGENFDKLKSGNYLISSVRHGISGDAATSTLELMTDSLADSLFTAVTFSGALQGVKAK